MDGVGRQAPGFPVRIIRHLECTYVKRLADNRVALSQVQWNGMYLLANYVA